MKVLKSLFAAALVSAAALSVTGCAGLQDLNAHGQELRAKDPAAYSKLSGDDGYFSQNPQFNVHGS
ncbi:MULTISPECIES: hypothetical protein [Pseudomonas]|uniref:hypothetical protein n=1 Tax=Pseudomonas TaxID=286 RepID=UPI001474F420|nr:MULTISPECIES: hypothetical protein [Pseudomonas]MEC4242009.1 hypothetical protein [Pseudomonas sp. DSV-1]NNB33948.1 hypothetical protein [Pseudomonas fragi]